MAYTKSDLKAKAGTLFSEEFRQYETEVVPDISDSRFTHGATGMSGEFSFLYSDMRGSSSLSDSHRRKTITKIYKAFHHCMVETVKHKGGKVRSFDGDRVLAVFSGSWKADCAVECAMLMVGCLKEVILPKLKQYYNNETFDIGIGIATGKSMVSKAGVGYDQNNRDLVWIGDAPNLGAKLSDSASSYFIGRIMICAGTFGGLSDANKYHTNEWGAQTNMWNHTTTDFAGSQISAYHTGYYCQLC